MPLLRRGRPIEFNLDLAIELHNKGKTPREIARELSAKLGKSITTETIKHHFKKMGIPVVKPARATTAEASRRYRERVKMIREIQSAETPVDAIDIYDGSILIG